MNHDDSAIESLLGRYRPVSPPPGMRDRVLSLAVQTRSWWIAAGWFSAAAMVLLALGLHLAAARMMQETAAVSGIGRIEWSAEAEEAAQMLNGDGAGRRYVALALAAGMRRHEGFPPVPMAPGLFGEM